MIEAIDKITISEQFCYGFVPPSSELADLLSKPVGDVPEASVDCPIIMPLKEPSREDYEICHCIIIGRPTFNLIGSALSTLYLSTKYPLNSWRIVLIQRDQETIHISYQDKLRIKRATMAICVAPQPDLHGVNFVDLDPREEPEIENSYTRTRGSPNWAVETPHY
ncbi:unnamed protein product [Vicia faba]|uniref:Uncharacterized protein n=1 Tax=Vicia faba TaxID=3906 RepID=A0AAV0ZBM2_VICFA|nr:unnamed protein product [Vicia faba]